MKDLEKLVKSSFDNFEPEVGSDVWQKLEQGLNNLPSSSASGNAAVKGLAIKGSTMAWVAGAIITAAITASLVFSGNSAEDKKPTENAAAETISVPVNESKTTTEAEPVQSRNVQTNSINSSSVPQLNVNTSTTPVADQASGSPAELKAGVVNEPSAQHNVVADQANVSPAKTNSDNTSSPQNNDVVKAAPESDNSENNSDQDSERIIYSGSCGFAPFKVVLLLNDANAKGNWDFGDGNATQSMNTTSHIFKKEGTYVITCKTEHAELTQTIEVIGTVSNAFTPNGDGKNDEFFVDAPIEELLLKVFSRSGRLEYEMKQPGQHWDGKNENGEDLPSGTYFYDIFARSINGQTITQKGTINILR